VTRPDGVTGGMRLPYHPRHKYGHTGLGSPNVPPAVPNAAPISSSPVTCRAPCAQIIKLPVTETCHYNRRASDGRRERSGVFAANRGGLAGPWFAVGNDTAFGV